MKIVVGLGNPGSEFENTRHNMGFLVIEKLAKLIADSKWQIAHKFDAEIIKKDDLFLVKPQTFMNESGRTVRKLLDYYYKPFAISHSLNNLYVVHDDLDIIFGEFKIQYGKGPKVHNGILSIEQSLGTKDFWRVRVGVDSRVDQDHSIPGRAYVLKKFDNAEKEIANQITQNIAKEIESTLLLNAQVV